jgi:hypothetical protein
LGGGWKKEEEKKERKNNRRRRTKERRKGRIRGGDGVGKEGKKIVKQEGEENRGKEGIDR